MAKQEVDTYHDDGPPHPADVAEQERRPVAMAPIIPAVTQTTAIEVGRATAEVQAMVVVAQAKPRDEDDSVDKMVRMCGRITKHKDAFYSYKRGNTQIVGLNVGMMRQLLRYWGNAASGVNELQRLPGKSELQAWAWDLEANYRQSITFWWNHIRELSDKPNVELTGDRDIYELNANMGARREREMIRRVLPSWYVSRAEEECNKTLAGDPAKFPQRFEEAVKRFKSRWGVTQEMLEERLGGPRESWGAVDLTTLGVIYSSIIDRETTLEDEFPGVKAKGSAASSLAEAKQAGGKAASPPVPAPEPGAATTGSGDTVQPPAGRPMGEGKAEALATIRAAFTEAKWGGQSAAAKRLRLDILAGFARPDQDKDPLAEVAKDEDLTAEQAKRVASRLQWVLDHKADKDPHERLANLARKVQAVRDAAAGNPPPPEEPRR